MAVDLDPHKYRRITARSVTLPREKWYKRIRIPGVTEHRSSPYSNSVHTTKYTVINFLPKNLWEQFHRFANIYFLFLALLNFIPAVEAFGKEVGYLPLLFVLTVTALKDIFQDYRRYKSDKEVNGLLTWVYNWEQGNFVERKWSKVCVGDVIQLSCDDVIPADILLLHSSDPDGTCFIETANIDGETNLKQRQVALGAVETIGTSGSDSFNPRNFDSSILCEQPHCEIYNFNGYILRPSGEQVGVNRRNLLLRGCILRNTTSVAGIVVYAGHETKALLNNNGPRIKRSKLERDINTEIVFQLTILFILCFIGAVGNGIWTEKHVDKNIIYFPYTSDNVVPALEGFIRFWTFIIIFQVIVPVSLYISMEVVKFIQIFFINWDINMYYQPTDRPFQCRALNINEDLGQIHYILTDKTGTLTENQMVFRCCCIGEKNYPHSLEAEFIKYRYSCVAPTLQTIVEDTDFPNSPEHPLLLDSTLQSDLKIPALSKAYLRDFFVVMAICNTVVIHKDNCQVESQWSQGQFVGWNEGHGQNDDPVDTRSIVYEAESPDEAALVEAARSYGYALVSRTPCECSIRIPDGRLIHYRVLHLLEFDPIRKCMSIIVKEKGGSKLILYSKGADSTIYSNLAHRSGSCSEATPTPAELTQHYLSVYATLGLRTLCLARRILLEEEYSVWLEQRQQAEVALEGRDSLLFDSACNIEKDLELLGATGIEDRLQDRVPETIESLRSSGIKMWVLTGDKQETAINIGYSSRLIDEDMDIIVINATSMEECRDILESRRQELTNQAQAERGSSTSSTESVFSRMSFLRPILGTSNCDSDVHNRLSKALIIDGHTLMFALDESLKVLFLDIARQCRSVICNRVTPLQKAAIVELVKVKLHQVTLAIGDGANDVSMIQKADVGVGIAGKEGMQAVMASDFAMGRFQFLEKLLLVHGHWCYSRLARMMLYFFYKNVGLAALLFWFQLFNGFSGSFPIDAINIIMYSLVFTSVPVVVVAIADQDLRVSTLLTDHTYYEEGRCSKVYTRWKFWLSMLDAFYQSAVVFFVAYGAYYDSVVGITEFGFVINISMILTVSLHLAVETLHWTIINHIALWGSVVLTFIINYIYTAIDTRQRFMDTYWLMYQTSSHLQFWFVLILTPMISLLPRMIGKAIEQELCPSPVLTARSKEKLLRKKEKILKTVHMNDSQDNILNYCVSSL